MRLILVRHGQTTSNLGGLLDTDTPGADLTELGREQAERLTDALHEHDIGAVYASTLVRTQQTARPLAEKLGVAVAVLPGLREITAGDLEMLGDHHSVRIYLETAFAWSDGELGRRVPGGEDGHDVYGRYDDAIRQIAGAGVETALAVSHGAVLRSWCAARTKNVTTEYAARNVLANTGVIVLQGEPGDWTAVTWEGHALGSAEDGGEHGPAGQRVERRDR